MKRSGGGIGRWAALAALGAALACAAAPGCTYIAKARLWADTALEDGRFSTDGDQWAYDGEPVTFDLQVDPGAVNFVVFGIEGVETVVTVPESAGHYRWTHTFRCGHEPKSYEVYAMPMVIRGKCDWVYDSADDSWEFYPGRLETPDVQTAREQTVRITCYRRTARFRFTARGGRPKDLALTFVLADGRRVPIPRADPKTDARGFRAVGPDAEGTVTVTYTPAYGEVNRSGTTQAELIVEHADGTSEELIQAVETP